MKYWLISGLKGPRFAQNLKENFDRLGLGKSPDVRAIVVVTGPEQIVPRGAIELQQPKPGVTPFLETAFEYLYEHADIDDWFVRIDADDYYGPEYMPGVRDAEETLVDFSGIQHVFVRDENEELYFCHSKEKEVRGFFGGTLAGRIGTAVPFRNLQTPWGEDSEWFREMRSHDLKFFVRSPKGYAMLRHANHEHTWPVPGTSLPHFLNCSAFHYGKWDPEFVAALQGKDGTYVEPDARLAVLGSRALEARLLAESLTPSR